jgi:hypothetical protein
MYLLADIMPTAMFLAGCALLTAILLRRSYRYFGRRRGSNKNETAIDHQPRPTDAWSGMQKDVAAHLQRQEVELFDFARDVAGQLDSKMRVLQQLIAESNQQIERMEQLLDDAERQNA